jgi:hypothetical protein
MKLQVRFMRVSRSLKDSTDSGVVEHSPRIAMAVSGAGYLHKEGSGKMETERSAQLQT